MAGLLEFLVEDPRVAPSSESFARASITRGRSARPLSPASTAPTVTSCSSFAAKASKGSVWRIWRYV